MSEHVEVTETGGVVTVTLNRSEKKNALTRSMYTAMADALTRLDEMAELRTLVLTGTGDFFTSGNDINDFIEHPPCSPDSPVSKFLAGISTARKPLIAAVNGSAVGVGLTMLLHCDLVYVAEDARLTAPFTKLALVPEAASSMLLPQRVGHAKAGEIFLMGKAISGTEAAAIGLAGAALPASAVMGAATQAASTIAKLPPGAIQATKSLMRQPPEPVPDRMAREGKIFGERLTGPEAREAFTAFMQKREPDFSQFG